MMSEYNGDLTGNGFLFREIRIIAGLICGGMSPREAEERAIKDNMFQYPTERSLRKTANCCQRRLAALGSERLAGIIAGGAITEAKQVNLYAIMKENRLVREFMISVIGEKYRTRDGDFSKRDINAFFFDLRRQDERVARWSDSTVTKIGQVLMKMLAECEYVDSVRSEKLNPVYLYPALEEALRDESNTSAMPAFNYII